MGNGMTESARKKRFTGNGIVQPGAKPDTTRKTTKAEDEVYLDEQEVRVNKSRKARGLPPIKRR